MKMGTVIGKLDRKYNSIAVGDTVGTEVDGGIVTYTVDSFGGLVKEDGTRLAPKQWKGEAFEIPELAETSAVPEEAPVVPESVSDMMSAADIAGELAEARTVEAVVCRIAHRPMSDDLADLSQLVYEVILTYDAARLNDLRDCGQLENFIARIVLNQYRSASSPFHYVYRRFRSLCFRIGLSDWPDA